ncbi:MAG: hypothetical protein OK436_00905 [Thaumarchaeota archaeon]|nr:hypothetical protein [Nitrososphaerota archaeon]
MKRVIAVILVLSLLATPYFATPVVVTNSTRQSKYGTLTNVYFETASGPGSSTPGTNTAQTPSGTSNSYSIVQGSSGYLWSPQFSGVTVINTGNWVLDFWTAGLSYIPITITNNQATATPNPLQVAMSWNPSTYSTYESSDLGNLRFCSDIACNTMLFSWLESCTPSCTPSATSASAWVKLTSTIAASGGTLTIYMVFLSTSNDFDGVNWGEAPELSGSYAQFDNGANVFLEYNNGNSLFSLSHTGTGGVGPSTTATAPSPFTHAITGSVAGATANANTWTTNGNTGSPALPSSFIAQMLVQITGTTPLIDMMTNVGSITTGHFYVFRLDARAAQHDLVGYYASGAGTATIISSSATTSSTGTWYQLTAIDAADTLSLYRAAAGSTSNFGTLGTVEVNSVVGQGYSGGGIAVTTDGKTSTDYFTLIIIRAYPPSNVMPSASFGAVSSNKASVSIYITDSTGTITSTVASNVLSPGLGTSETQYTMVFSGAQVTIPANGYISVVITASSDTCTVYWGVGQPTNFQVPFRVLS